MKREMHPAIIAAVVAVVVACVAFFGYRSMQPAAYTPSPGVQMAGGGSPPGAPPGANRPLQPTDSTSYYPAAPAGSIPGKPIASGH